MKTAASLSIIVALAGAVLSAQRPMPSHTAASAVSPDTVREVARVNGVALTSDRLAATLSTLIPQESFHRNVSPEKLAALRRQALATVIDEELMYQDGIRRGLTASPVDLRAAMRQTVARYGGAARFDAAIRQARLTRASVEREIGRRLIVEKNFGRAVMDHCRVSAADAELFFARNPERFVEPEQLHVHAITVGVDPSSGQDAWKAARTRADDARRQLDAGAAFADVAKTFSTDASREKGGDMGFLHRGSLASPFEAIVGTLPVGAPSAVVESLYGYHVVLVSEIRPPQRRTFEQVSTTLVNELSETRCTEQKEAWLAGLRAAATIQEAGAVR